MPYIIRKALFTDIEQIQQIEQESINSWTYSQFLEELKHDFAVLLVYETEGQICGYISAWIIEGQAEIISFAVTGDSGRQGIGSKLFMAFASIALENNSRSIILEVRSRNIPALNFYRKKGFTEKGMRKNYYPDDDAILMEKILT